MVDKYSDDILSFLIKEKPEKRIFSGYSNFFQKAFSSIKKENKFINFIIVFVILYVFFNHTLDLNIKYSQLTYIIFKNTDNQIDYLGNNNIYMEIVNKTAYLNFISYVFPINFNDFSVNSLSSSYLYYISSGFIILYYLVMYLLGKFSSSNIIFKIFYYINFILSYILSMSFLKINFVFMFDFIKYFIFPTWMENNSYILFPLLSILNIVSMLLICYMIIYTNIILNDLRLFNRSLNISDFSLIKKISFGLYIIINSLIYAILHSLLYNNPYISSIQVSYFNSLLIESIPYLTLIKSIVIVIYIGYDLVYPFFIERNILYWRAIDKYIYMIFDLISQIQVFINLVFFNNFNYIVNFEGIVIFFSISIILTFLMIIYILHREMVILEYDIKNINTSELSMCYAILIWRLFNINYLDKDYFWLINHQIDLHKVNCIENNCICEEIESFDFSNIQFQIKQINAYESNKNHSIKNKTSNRQSQVELIKEIHFNEITNIKEEVNENSAKEKKRFILLQQLFFILLSNLNSKFPNSNSYFIYIQSCMLIYLSKSYFQGIQKCMVFENNINKGFYLVKSHYEIFKDGLFRFISNYLFMKDDNINIKKLTLFEKNYDSLLTQMSSSLKKYIKLIKIINKSNIRDIEVYSLLLSLVVSIEKIQVSFDIINTLIPNEIRTLKLLCLLNLSILDDKITIQYAYNQLLMTLNNINQLNIKLNAYFKDNSNPGILCFSGNLNNLATITYCNKQFHNLLNHIDKSLIGTNVNNIMHELFAKHHDFFILEFYKTNKIHNINKDNVVFAQSKTNLLIPLRQLVKVLPNLNEGIFYIGYDLDYKNGINKNDAYLIFSLETGYIYSFDKSFKTLFKLDSENVCINSNNNSNILSISHLFDELYIKFKKKEILDNIEFELNLNFNKVKDNLLQSNFSENNTDLDDELNNIINIIKSNKSSFTCIATINKVSISNGLIKFGILKVKLNSIYLLYKKMLGNTEKNEDSVNEFDIKAPSSILKPNYELQINMSNLNIIDNKDTVKDHNNHLMKEYILKLNSFSTFKKENLTTKVLRYDLLLSIFYILASIIFLILIVINKNNFLTTFKETYIYQYNIHEYTQYLIDIPFLVLSKFIMSTTNLSYIEKNSMCYSNKTQVLDSEISKIFQNIYKFNDLINLSNSNSSLSYYYYQYEIDKLNTMSISEINKIEYIKTIEEGSNILKVPLNDLQIIYNLILTNKSTTDIRMKSNDKDTNILKQLIISIYNFNMEVFKYLTYENTIKENQFYFKNDNSTTNNRLIFYIQFFIFGAIYILKIYIFYILKNQKKDIVKIFCFSKEELKEKIKTSNSIEAILKNIESDKRNMELIESSIREERLATFKSLNFKNYIINNSCNSKIDNELSSPDRNSINKNEANQSIESNDNHKKNHILARMKEKKKSDISNVFDDKEKEGNRIKDDSEMKNLNKQLIFKDNLNEERKENNDSDNISIKKSKRGNKLNKSTNDSPRKVKINQKTKEFGENPNFKLNLKKSSKNKMRYLSIADNNSQKEIKPTIQSPKRDGSEDELDKKDKQKVNIISTIAVNIKRIIYIVVSFIFLVGLFVLSYSINELMIFQSKNIIITKSTFDNYITSLKISSYIKILIEEYSFQMTEQLNNNLNVTLNRRLEYIRNFSLISKYDTLYFLDKSYNITLDNLFLCNYYNQTCCREKSYLSKGFYNFLIKIEKELKNSNDIQILYEKFDILFIFLNPIKEYLHENILSTFYSLLNIFSTLLDFQIVFYTLWLMITFILIFIKNMKIIKKVSLSHEKMICLLSKKIITTNQYIIHKLIKF